MQEADHIDRAVDSAFARAWIEVSKEPPSWDLQRRHTNRSMLFVRYLGKHLERVFNRKGFRVHRSRQKESVKGPTETQRDIDVFRLDRDGLVLRNIWQIESEFAYTGPDPLNPTKLRGNLREDLNKLISGCARNSLLVTSAEWLSDDREWFLNTIQKAAIRWHSSNRTTGVFFVALIPYVSKWHRLTKEELRCQLLKFDRDRREFLLK